MDLPLPAEAAPPPLSDEADPAFLEDLVMKSAGQLLSNGMPILLMTHTFHPLLSPIPILREVGMLEWNCYVHLTGTPLNYIP